MSSEVLSPPLISFALARPSIIYFHCSAMPIAIRIPAATVYCYPTPAFMKSGGNRAPPPAPLGSWSSLRPRKRREPPSRGALLDSWALITDLVTGRSAASAAPAGVTPRVLMYGSGQ